MVAQELRLRWIRYWPSQTEVDRFCQFVAASLDQQTASRPLDRPSIWFRLEEAFEKRKFQAREPT